MVKFLSKSSHTEIADAIAKAELATRAEIVTTVVSASDDYQTYSLLLGIFIGGISDIALWLTKTLTEFPWLFAVQLAVISLFAFTPLRHLGTQLAPKHLRHHRAQHRAYEQYLAAAHHLSTATPFVLLYVSLAERYAHILSNHIVREKIPDATWNMVMDELLTTVRAEGPTTACVKAIGRTAELLAAHFPKTA